jgi:TP901 family phage tail tape measure protein
MALNQMGLGLLFTATDLASGVMAKVRNGFSQTRNEAGQFGTQSKAAFKEFGTGLAIMGVGLGGLASLIPAIEAAGEFNKAIAETSTMVDEATFPVAKMRELTMQLAGEYGKMAPEETKALYQSISAGATDASKATGLLHAANKLAIGGVSDVKTAVDGLTNVMNSYNIEYEHATDVSDAFFVAIKAGKTTIPEMASTIGRLAPTAQAVGVSFTEMIGAVSAVTTKGLKTEEAITGLKAALANVIKPTSDAAAEATRLGIKFDATTLRAKGFPAFLQMITTNAKFNADSMSKLFGSIEGLNSIMALTANGGAAFSSVLEGMAKRTGETDKAFGIMSATIQMDRFKALGNNALILVGEGLIPLKNAILKVANSMLESFGRIPKPMIEMGVKLFALASAAMVLVGGLIATHAAVLIFIAGLKFAGITAVGLAATIAPAIIAVGALGLAFAAFKVAIDNNVGGIADTMTDLYEGFKLGLDAIGQLLTDGGFSGTVREALSKPGSEGIRAFAINVYLWVERVKTFFGSLVTSFETAIKGAEPVFANFTRALDELAEAFGLADTNAAEAASTYDAFGSSGASTGRVLGQVASIIVTAMSIVMDVVTGAKLAWDGLSEVFAPLGAAVSSMGQTFMALMGDLGMLNGKAGEGASVWKGIGTVLVNVVSVAITLVGGVVRMMADQFRNASTTIGGVVDIIGGIFTGRWDRIWRGVQRVVFGVVMTIIDILGGLVSVVLDTVDALGKAFGADIGIGKGFRDFRDNLRGHLQTDSGLGTGFTGGQGTQAQSAGIGSNTSTFMPMPSVALVSSQGGMPMSQDPAAMEAVAARAAASAMAKMPPPSVNAVMMVDAEQLGTIAMNSQAAKGARSFVSTPVTENQ